ncbi:MULTISPECIES: EAL domain-containing protein [unclassified Paenibacillus]|uniref:EAL domain-containing protein n=1 Tax=unclassified Paenibacillus TaxID=185978 RepID=UPI00095593C7|nr:MULTISPECIES: EAL domain-containing protein [unclassified Paenibacillus]ASS67756.1 EAL domain-containing protein [Paenibacillus sp. RUD330]SIR61461.1 EAL domain, c-di-GMP-specific phosphodiesterase class I (or its enzymatically inactive variant) [Paenibacillus sp. RU4X]SIR70084.1 EAL domain, c-di-GMP-specific phosphodiesterase class I (or its enzymatically inactive variant) [Paenibacillus sp. RU4T]
MTMDSSERPEADQPSRPQNPRAYYQPILALDTRIVTGYEVLGRDCGAFGARSLGAYFSHPGVSEEAKRELDAFIREQAVQEHGRMRRTEKLFINLQPGWLSGCSSGSVDSSVLHMLKLLERWAVDPALICIEVTEEDFDGEIECLVGAVREFRRAGCSIAVDDVGSRFSNLDRIAHIQPDMLKVDMNMVSRSAHHEGFHGVLRSLSAIADGIGASLLMEGVETRQDLQRAISAGARYVQGYLFSGAEAAFGSRDRYKRLLDSELLETKRKQAGEESGRWKQAEELACEAERLLRDSGGEGGEEAFLAPLLRKLDAGCIRAYLCRSDGIQLSANYQRTEGGWIQEERYRGSDWSWRPYFVYSSVELLSGRRFAISRPYTDLDRNGRVRTVSLPAGPDMFLLVDVREDELG